MNKLEILTDQGPVGSEFTGNTSKLIGDAFGIIVQRRDLDMLLHKHKLNLKSGKEDKVVNLVAFWLSYCDAVDLLYEYLNIYPGTNETKTYAMMGASYGTKIKTFEACLDGTEEIHDYQTTISAALISPNVTERLKMVKCILSRIPSQGQKSLVAGSYFRHFTDLTEQFKELLTNVTLFIIDDSTENILVELFMHANLNYMDLDEEILFCIKNGMWTLLKTILGIDQIYLNRISSEVLSQAYLNISESTKPL